MIFAITPEAPPKAAQPCEGVYLTHGPGGPLSGTGAPVMAFVRGGVTWRGKMSVFRAAFKVFWEMELSFSAKII